MAGEGGMKNKLIEKKEKGVKMLGTFMSIGNESNLECIGLAGFDFVCIDMEHGMYSYQKMLDLIRTADYYGITPIVRTRGISRSAILKPADAGAGGIIVPMVRDVNNVKQIIEYGKYNPLGQRGMCPNRCSDYGEKSTIKNRPFTEYFLEENEHFLVLPQCETKEFLQVADEILFMPGVDGTMIGPHDLAISMGHPGDIFCMEVRQAMMEVLKKCKEYNKLSMIACSEVNHAREYLKLGFDAVIFGLESSLLINWYRSLLEQIKE